MTNERIRLLERTPGLRLTVEEMRDGWHFCVDFDYGLTQGEQVDKQGRCAWCGFDKRRVSPLDGTYAPETSDSH